jgi:hypothetical protein
MRFGCLILHVLSYNEERQGDMSSVLQAIDRVIDRKSKKRPWAWLIVHAVAQLELSPSAEKVLKTIFSLSNGPVEWKGNLISLYELKMLSAS